MNKDLNQAVGKALPHDSAIEHVTGEAVYIGDIPFTKGELLVDFWASPLPSARITNVDLAAASKVMGILGLYTYKDLDGENQIGPVIKDEVLLAEDTVNYIGQPVVIIAGDTKEAISQAKSLIKIDLEALKPVLSIEEAMNTDSYIDEPQKIECGDIKAGFKEADHVLEGTLKIGGQDHFYLESQAAIVYPGEAGSLVIYSSTQNPTETQILVARLLGLNQSKVVCTCKRMGGGFGGKETQSIHFAAMAALVAYKSRRPARIVLTKDMDMQSTGKRHPYINRYKVGFTKEGRVTALEINYFSDGGASADLSLAVIRRTLTHGENAYYIPNILFTGRICKTNNPPNTALRGFGAPQAIIAIENIMEEIAIFLAKDACEIRVLNCYGIDERNITPYGTTVNNNWLPEILKVLPEKADYKSRVEAIKLFNNQSRTHLKGISLTTLKFGISFNTAFLNQGSALVNIYLDGTVQVSTGGTEMGQGLQTKIRQLVADEFSILPDDIVVMPTSTEKNNNTSATAASCGTDINGSAAVIACQNIKKRLKEYLIRLWSEAEHTPHIEEEDIMFESEKVYNRHNPKQSFLFKELVKKAYMERISLGERGFYITPGLYFDWNTGKGNPFLYYTTGCAISEVIIDRFTGELKVCRSDILMDIGESINPGIDRGQIAGAFIQGMGWLTTEELKFSDDGNLLTHSPTTYKIPNIHDIPEVFNIDWVDNCDNRYNIRRSKAVGEPPLVLAVSVWTAIKNALAFISPGKIPQLKVPATNEEIIKQINELVLSKNS